MAFSIRPVVARRCVARACASSTSTAPTRAVTASLRLYSSSSAPVDAPSTGELGVGELQGAKFRIEPLRRTGEDAETKRARLVCTFCCSLPLSLRYMEGKDTRGKKMQG